MLLTDEETGEIIQQWLDGKIEARHVSQAIAKAQFKKVVEELKGRIEMLGNFDHQDSAYSKAKDKRWYFYLNKPQEEWDKFWQALLEEVR